MSQSWQFDLRTAFKSIVSIIPGKVFAILILLEEKEYADFYADLPTPKMPSMNELIES